MNLKTIKDRIVALLKDKSSGIQPEFRQQLADIAKRIEEELDYPGQIRVTVVREIRTTEIAK